MILLLRYVIDALESIRYDAHRDRVPTELRDSWPHNVKTEAEKLLHSITTFEFITNFCIVYSLLSPLEGITTKLQGRCNDICSAHTLVNATFMLLNNYGAVLHISLFLDIFEFSAYTCGIFDNWCV